MENENKEQNQEQKLITEWDEKQVYEAEILPKIMEVCELLKKHNIPFLFHAVPAQGKESAKCTLISSNCDKCDGHIPLIAISANILDGNVDGALKNITMLALLKNFSDKG